MYIYNLKKKVLELTTREYGYVSKINIFKTTSDCEKYFSDLQAENHRQLLIDIKKELFNINQLLYKKSDDELINIKNNLAKLTK